jgi:hypothetical protein
LTTEDTATPKREATARLLSPFATAATTPAQIIGERFDHPMLTSNPASILNHNPLDNGIPPDSINLWTALMKRALRCIFRAHFDEIQQARDHQLFTAARRASCDGAAMSWSHRSMVFKEVKLNRGRAMGFASQDSWWAMWSAAKSWPAGRQSFSSLISIASPSFCETFHGFNKFIHLRIDIIVYQITRRQRNLHFERTVVDNRNPMRLRQEWLGVDPHIRFSLYGDIVNGLGEVEKLDFIGRPAWIATRLCRIVGEHARHGRQVADVTVHDPKQGGNGGLICGDAVKVAHLGAQEFCELRPYSDLVLRNISNESLSRIMCKIEEINLDEVIAPIL